MAGQPAPLPATPASLSHRDPLPKEATAFCPTEGDTALWAGLRVSGVSGPDSICSLPALGWRPLPLVRVAVLPLVGHSCQGTRAVVHSGSHFPPGHARDSSLLGGSPDPGLGGRTLSLSIHRDMGPGCRCPDSANENVCSILGSISVSICSPTRPVSWRTPWGGALVFSAY